MMGFGQGLRIGGYGMHSFGGIFMMILFWIFIIMGIVYLVKNFTNNNANNNNSNNCNTGQRDNAVNIARERYARGEISKEELTEIINNLK
ncbi:MAG: SHOCT domain-containing protein [Firmicutes bacterium]|nr:SHOCT domain-containing protein [Bacillota bacterium]